jgi:predicted MFS family arabinose efflux permease
VFAAVCLVEHVEASDRRFDLVGFALAVPGLGLVMYALDVVGQRGPASPHFWMAGSAGLACVTALIVCQLRTRQPMLDLRLFADPSFRRASIVLGFCMMGFLGTLYAFSLMYQTVLGASAWETGLVTLPKAVGLMLASQVVTGAHARMGPRRLIATAVFGAAVSFALMNTVDTAWIAGFVQLASGFFVGVASIELQVVAFATISRSATGGASTLFTVQRQIGSALGVAVTASVLGAGGAGHGDLAAYHAGMLVCAGFALVGAFLALRIRDTPTESMVAPRSSPPRGRQRPASMVRLPLTTILARKERVADDNCGPGPA